MKVTNTILALLLASLALCGFKPTPQTMNHNHSNLTDRISRMMDSIYQKHPETRGITVHVEAPRYQLAWKGAVGFADRKGRPLTPEMPANIASNTKTYIAATILRLVELGKLTTTEPIQQLISEKSNALLVNAGYNTRAITVAHLLTNTSGITDFVNTPTYQHKTVEDPAYRWTREEQIELATRAGKCTVSAGETFAYSETNYSLLTEIIERKAQQPFHLAVRRLLKFEPLKLNHTWWLLQEQAPQHTPPLVEQTASIYQVNSYVLDYSFDAFGGGGLAATVTDLAHFSQNLFNGKVFDQPATQALLYTTVSTADGSEPTYSFGLMHTTVAGYKAYGHGGFWGTQVKYIPALNLSIAVFVMERDSWTVYNTLIESIVEEIAKQPVLH